MSDETCRPLAERAYDFIQHDEACSSADESGPGDCDCIAAEIVAALAAASPPPVGDGRDIDVEVCTECGRESRDWLRSVEGHAVCARCRLPAPSPVQGGGLVDAVAAERDRMIHELRSPQAIVLLRDSTSAGVRAVHGGAAYADFEHAVTLLADFLEAGAPGPDRLCVGTDEQEDCPHG